MICTNPAHSWINQTQCRDILERLDFLVVQDIYKNTETAQMADLVLPAAGWAEKEGTFINSERRIGTLKKVRKAPGQALADFSIFKAVAEYWGCGEMFREWSSPESTFQILKECSRDMPCDITGIEGYRMLDECGGIQWPFAGGRTSAEGRGTNAENTDSQLSTLNHRLSQRRLFEDPRPLSEPPNERFPFVLLTGRGTASQWHTQTRTKQSAVLRKLYPKDAYVEINPSDARRAGIRHNSRVIVESQRGRILASAFVTHGVQPGQLFVPMHYEPVNQLTDPVFDPYSKQPSYKACAANVIPAA